MAWSRTNYVGDGDGEPLNAPCRVQGPPPDAQKGHVVWYWWRAGAEKWGIGLCVKVRVRPTVLVRGAFRFQKLCRITTGPATSVRHARRYQRGLWATMFADVSSLLTR